MQAGGDLDCFSNMVIVSKGLVNIDAKIFSDTDGCDGFTKNAKHCVLLWSIVFLVFFFIFRKKTMLYYFMLTYIFSVPVPIFLNNEKSAG